jgi:hypothetical protein
LHPDFTSSTLAIKELIYLFIIGLLIAIYWSPNGSNLKILNIKILEIIDPNGMPV